MPDEGPEDMTKAERARKLRAEDQGRSLRDIARLLDTDRRSVQRALLQGDARRHKKGPYLEYAREWKRARAPRSACVICGADVTQFGSGRTPRYCSEACKRAAQALRALMSGPELARRIAALSAGSAEDEAS